MSEAAQAGGGRDRTILLAGLITYGIGQSLLYVIFGPLARDIGLTETQFGVLISASNVALIFSSPRWGRASDSLGRRTVFVIGLLGFAVGYGGLAFGVQVGLWGWMVATPLFLALLVARLVYGVFAGGVNPAAAAYIADTTDAASRAKGMALVAAAGGIGSILGPAVGGVLAEVGPVFPMYAAAGVALLAAGWARFGLVEPQRHVPSPDGPRLKFTDPRIFPYLYGWFIMFLVFTAVQVITAFYVTDQIGIVGRQDVIRVTSLALVSMALVTVVVQVVVMQTVKLQPRLLLRVALICFGLSLWVLAAVSSVAGLVLAYALMGLTASFAMPSLSAAASLSVEPHEQGAAAGLLTAAPTLGMIFGPALGAVLYQQNIFLPLYLGGAAMVLSGVYFWFVKVPDAHAAAAPA
jgi:MFS family permease